MKLVNSLQIPDKFYEQIAPYLSGVSLHELSILMGHLNSDSKEEFQEFVETVNSAKLRTFCEITDIYLQEYISERSAYKTELFTLASKVPSDTRVELYGLHTNRLGLDSSKIMQQVNMVTCTQVMGRVCEGDITITNSDGSIRLTKINRNTGTAVYINEGKRKNAQVEFYSSFLSVIVDDHVVAVAPFQA